MAFPPSRPPFIPAIPNPNMSILNINPSQYQMNPMVPIAMSIPTLQGSQRPTASMGITLPTGVTTISAPPVRKIIPDNALISTTIQQSQLLTDQNRLKAAPAGASITVFVGNITDRASDMLIRQLLSKCGSVVNWKRVQGANGKLQAFGFCEYSDMESAIRAIRMLHDFEIGDKNLVVKVDAKTKEKLDEYTKLKSGSSDDQSNEEDELIKNQLKSILKEHELELSRSPDPSRDRTRRNDIKKPEELLKTENLADLEIEEEKRSLIHREIDKFRDTYKNEEEKEIEKKEQSEKDNLKNEDKNRDKNRSKSEKMSREKSQKNDRIFDNRNDRYDELSSDRGIENEEEFYEQKRIERKLREKEASYQERLRNWEARESRKKKEHEKYLNKMESKRDEEAKEIRRLKQFLEDYDDFRDDSKFYKAASLNRRFREYQKEKEDDDRDRRQEKRELEELRRRLIDEGHPDPEKEAKKRLNSSESLTGREKIVNAKIKELMKEARYKTYEKDENDISMEYDDESREEIHVKSFTFTGMKIGQNASPSEVEAKRKNISVKDIFNPNEDDDDLFSGKRRKLPSLLEENTDSNQSSGNSYSNKAKNMPDSSKSISSEEKRRQIKMLIEKIPTSKEELFRHTIDWSVVDNNLMDKRIKPWINKKITEYIGEEEAALLDFICTKISAKSSAQSILDDVAMVLDEEAEVFVVKMWRLLIYEIEAKKLGLGK